MSKRLIHLVDNEAGVEWISRYRLTRITLLLVVTTPTRAAQAVAGRIERTARQVGLQIDRLERVVNCLPAADRSIVEPAGSALAALPADEALVTLDRQGRPVIDLAANHPLRAALSAVLARLWPCA